MLKYINIIKVILKYKIIMFTVLIIVLSCGFFIFFTSVFFSQTSQNSTSSIPPMPSLSSVSSACSTLFISSENLSNNNSNNSNTSVTQIPKQTIPTDYIEQVQGANGKEQAKAILNLLDSNSHYVYGMIMLGQFLETPLSKEMSVSDFQKLSTRLKIFKTTNGRVIEYEPDPLIHGELNSDVFAYYQTVIDNKIHVFPLYESTTKHIKYVLEMSRDFLVVAGEDQYINPYWAFVDGFSISKDTANLVPVLNEHTDSLWKITPSDGHIAGNTKNTLYSGTSIISTSKSKLTVFSNVLGKLTLKYEPNSKKYTPQN